MIVAQWKENGAELMRAGTPAENRGATTLEFAGRAAALGGEQWRALRSAGARSALKRADAIELVCKDKLS